MLRFAFAMKTAIARMRPCRGVFKESAVDNYP